MTLSQPTEARCRWEQAQRMQARVASEGYAVAHVPAYKAQAWLHRADHLQKHNHTLAHQLDLLSQRLLAAQQAQAQAELGLQHAVQAQVCTLCFWAAGCTTSVLLLVVGFFLCRRLVQFLAAAVVLNMQTFMLSLCPDTPPHPPIAPLLPPPSMLFSPLSLTPSPLDPSPP